MAMNTQSASATRRFFLWTAVIGCLVLAVLSVIPTSFGPAKAEQLFMSPFGATVWWAFALLLLVSLLVVPALRNRLGLLAMHAGMLVIVIGALVGSPVSLRLQKDLGLPQQFAKGFMIIYEGESTGRVLGETGTPIGELPFHIHLEDFRIEYYPISPDDPWEFTVEAVQQQTDGLRVLQGWQSRRVPWKPRKLDKPVKLPFCDIQLKVTGYELTRYGDSDDAPVLPTATLELARPGHTDTQTFRPQPGMPHVRMPLAGLYDSAKAWHDAGSPALRFHPPVPVIRDYFSDLVVVDGDTELARKTIEVNDPLHVGGYHFYQHSYDAAAGSYTILSVASDAGLSLVYAGFILLAGGLTWHVVSLKRKATPRGEIAT